MKLGKNIVTLRKKQGLSQEQLGEKVHVTRQTISNWELGETSPNPEQLKLLSKALYVSIDELLNNEIQEVLIQKISNTERLAGMVIKILKFLGIVFLIFLIIGIVAFVLFLPTGKLVKVESSASIVCRMSNQKYQIEFGTDDYFSCDNCSDKMKEELEKITDFNNIEVSISNIEKYFNNHGGTCE